MVLFPMCNVMDTFLAEQHIGGWLICRINVHTMLDACLMKCIVCVSYMRMEREKREVEERLRRQLEHKRKARRAAREHRKARQSMSANSVRSTRASSSFGTSAFQFFEASPKWVMDLCAYAHAHRCVHVGDRLLS